MGGMNMAYRDLLEHTFFGLDLENADFTKVNLRCAIIQVDRFKEAKSLLGAIFTDDVRKTLSKLLGPDRLDALMSR